MQYNEESGKGIADTTPSPEQTPVDKDNQDMPTSKFTRSPAFQFYPKEFLSSSKVIAMTATERGIYITLLSMQWLDGSLPDDLPALARLTGVNQKQFTRMWPHNLARCFAVKNGRLVNPRLEDVRREQVAYRKRQADNGAKGGRPSGKGLGSSGEASAIATESPSSASAPVSASSSAGTHRHGGAALHQSHRTHAACGRVCVPGDLHSRFVRSRNHDGADHELRDWYLVVDREWSDGEKKAESTGADDYLFWRARFNEKWPAVVAAHATSQRRPTWAPAVKV